MVNGGDALAPSGRLFIARVSRVRTTYSFTSLLAYNLNWQSVMFVGYGDDRELTSADRLEKLDRQFFIKLSYAFQR